MRCFPPIFCEVCEGEIVGIIMPFDICEDCYDGEEE